MSSSSSRSATSKQSATRAARGADAKNAAAPKRGGDLKQSPAPQTGAPKKTVVACPQCGAAVEWDVTNRFRPFCSERCKMNDLGAWATESYRIPVEEDKDTEE